MKTTLLPLLLLIVPLATFAQTAEPVPAAEAESQEVAQVDDARPDEAATGQDPDVEQDARRDCIRHTGTRIVHRAGSDGCVAAAGRVYSGTELQRTGAQNVADALRMLDPAIH